MPPNKSTITVLNLKFKDCIIDQIDCFDVKELFNQTKYFINFINYKLKHLINCWTKENYVEMLDIVH